MKFCTIKIAKVTCISSFLAPDLYSIGVSISNEDSIDVLRMSGTIVWCVPLPPITSHFSTQILFRDLFWVEYEPYKCSIIAYSILQWYSFIDFIVLAHCSLCVHILLGVVNSKKKKKIWKNIHKLWRKWWLLHSGKALPINRLPRYLYGYVRIVSFVPPNEIGHSVLCISKQTVYNAISSSGNVPMSTPFTGFEMPSKFKRYLTYWPFCSE